MAIVLPLNHPPYACTADTDPDWFGEDGMNLDALQHLVGGYIEHIQLNPPALYNGVHYPHLVFNEEGKLEGLPVNHNASTVAYNGGLPVEDFIVGPAIMLTDEEFQ